MEEETKEVKEETKEVKEETKEIEEETKDVKSETKEVKELKDSGEGKTKTLTESSGNDASPKNEPEKQRKRRKKTKMKPSDSVMKYDDVKNLAQILAYSIFEPPVPLATLQKVFFERIAKEYPKFMLATKMIRGNWYWLDHDFDINQHIKEVQENVPDLAGLQKFLSQLAGTGLNPDLPMWDVFLIPKFVCEDKVERSVIIFRLHHCLGDGVGLMQVLLGLLDQEGEEVKQVDTHKKPHGTISKVFKIPTYGFYKVSKLTFSSRDRNPVHAPKLTGTKQVMWSQKISLEDVKKIKNTLKVTVNDVLSSCVAGAFSKLFEGKQVVRKVKAGIPFNIRTRPDQVKIDNEFALLFISLPTSKMGPKERVFATKRKFDQKKNSVEPITNFGVQSLTMKSLPPSGIRIMVNHWLSKATCILTNVPGPTCKMKLAGHTMTEMLFFAPQRADCGTGVSIFSYNGSIQLGIMADTSNIQDPTEFVKAFEDSFQELKKEVLKEETSSTLKEESNPPLEEETKTTLKEESTS